MGTLIKDSNQIQALFSETLQTEIHFILFYSVHQKSDQALYAANSIGKIHRIDNEKKELTFLLMDADWMIDAQASLSTSHIKSTFVLNNIRYSFESQWIGIEKKDQNIIYVTISIPSQILNRKNRQSIRVSNTAKSVSAHETYITDISLSGAGILVPHHVDIQMQEPLELEIGIPSLFETDTACQRLVFNATCTRRTRYSASHWLLGLEFHHLNSLNQGILYHYIMARKNEVAFQISEIMPIKLFRINSVIFT